MKEFTITRNDITFSFRKPIVQKNNSIKLEYKIEDIDDFNKYQPGAIVVKERKTIILPKFEMNGKEYGGIGFGENDIDFFDDFYNKLYDEFMERKNKLFTEIVQTIVKGERLIEFKLVSYNNGYFKMSINNLPDELEGLKMDILDEAIQEYVRINGHSPQNNISFNFKLSDMI